MATPSQRRALQHALEFEPVGGSGKSIHLISQGVSELTEEFNPETEETHYIGDQYGTTTLKRYAMTVPLTMEYVYDDEVCKYIRNIAMTMPTGGDADVDYIRFSLLDGTGAGTDGIKDSPYTAYKYKASISISSMGGAGEDYLGIEAQINLRGDPTKGKIAITTQGDTKTYAFTADGTGT